MNVSQHFDGGWRTSCKQFQLNYCKLKIFKLFVLDKVKIPRFFFTKQGDELDNRVTIEDGVGNIFTVDIGMEMTSGKSVAFLSMELLSCKTCTMTLKLACWNFIFQ